MPLINVSVPNLINGVSQQADEFRFPSQATEQINAYSSIVEGLRKRPPLEHISKVISGQSDVSGFVKILNFSETEQYLLYIYGNATVSMKIFDLLDGTEKTINDAGGTPVTSGDLTYLGVTADMWKNLDALPVLDFIFLVNKTTTVDIDASLNTARDPEGLFFCKLVANSYDYTIKIFNTVSSTSPSYTATYSAGTTTNQKDVIANLVTNLNTAGANSLYTYSADGPIMHITRIDNTDFRIQVESSAPDAFFAFKDRVQSVAILPKKGYAGFEIGVDGDADVSDDVFYLKFEAATDATVVDTFAEGSWVETSKKGETYQVDNATMPHVLIKELDGTFTFKEEVWLGRTAGGIDSNPHPMFAGNKIREIFFFKNRLGFLSADAISLSEADNFFTFYRNSVLDLLDADPINVAATSNTLSSFNHATAFSEKLVLSTDTTQFSLEGREILTAETISTNESTSYSFLPDTAPVSIGNKLFYPFSRGNFSGLYEYALAENADVFEAYDVSDNIPQYVKGNVKGLAGETSENLIAMHTDDTDNPNIVYLYKFLTRSGQRAQQAWFKFDLGSDAEVIGLDFIDTTLYVLLNRHDHTYIEKIDMAAGVKDDFSDKLVVLDRKITQDDCTSISYSAATDETTMTLPYEPVAGSTLVVTTRANAISAKLRKISGVTFSGTTLTIPSDYSSDDLWIGLVYDTEYVMTRPTIRENSQGSSRVVKSGRFQLRYGRVSVDNTATFQVEVIPDIGYTYTYTYTGNVLDSPQALINSDVSVTDGVFTFPIFQENTKVTIKLKNSSPFQSNFLSIDWQGQYVSKTRRI